MYKSNAPHIYNILLYDNENKNIVGQYLSILKGIVGYGEKCGIVISNIELI